MATTPTVNLSQPSAALVVANDVRRRRAELKREVRGGQRTAAELIADPPAVLGKMNKQRPGMKVVELLMAQHRWGLDRSKRLLRGAGCTEMTTFDSLTDRQRRELVRRLTTP